MSYLAINKETMTAKEFDNHDDCTDYILAIPNSTFIVAKSLSTLVTGVMK